MTRVKGLLLGGLLGALIRPWAIVVFMAFHLDMATVSQNPKLLLGLIPSAITGIWTGWLCGLFAEPKRGAFYGAALSAFAFAAWSLGPLELWLVDIRFNWWMVTLFAAAGCLYGGLAGLAASRLDSRNRGKEVPFTETSSCE